MDHGSQLKGMEWLISTRNRHGKIRTDSTKSNQLLVTKAINQKPYYFLILELLQNSLNYSSIDFEKNSAKEYTDLVKYEKEWEGKGSVEEGRVEDGKRWRRVEGYAK